jgi:protein-disulfide isomerase
MKNKNFAIGLTVLVLIGFAIATFYSMRRETGREVFRVDPTRLSRAHSPTKGAASAKVSLVEFFDPECEACRALHPVIDKLSVDYGDRLKVVYRFTPLHPGSIYASSLLLEAQDAGKFESALGILFENQHEWGSHENPQPDLIPVYLKQIQLSPGQLSKGAVIAKHKLKLDQDQADSAALLVQQTPTFFINGRPTFSIDESVLRRMIDEELVGIK